MPSGAHQRCPLKTRWALFAAVAVALAGVLPYLWLLDIHPHSRDAIIWLQKADPSLPGWFDWTFATTQFKVTLRPVTALSYTLTHLLGGTDPAVHRGFDLLLHASTIGLTYEVVRRWSTGASQWGGVAAAAVVALHPLTRFVVPHLARRSYSLATMFILLALLAAARHDATDARRAWGGVGAAALAAAATLSHEIGYLAFALCAVLVVPPTGALWDVGAWRRAIQDQRWLLGSSVLLGAALLVWRLAALGGFGGYNKGTPTPLDKTGATLEALFPTFALASGPISTAFAIVWGLALLGAGAFAVSRRIPAGETDDPILRVALAWIAGGFLLFVPQSVWFIRQGYLLVPPLGLLIGGLLGGPLPRPGRGVALATLLALGLLAPVELGHIRLQRLRAERTSAMLEGLIEFAREVPDGEQIVLALPRWRSPQAVGHRGHDIDNPKQVARGARRDERRLPIGVRAPMTWLAHVVPGRTYTLALVAFTHPERTQPVWRAELVGRGLQITNTGAERIVDLPHNPLGEVDGDRAAVRSPRGKGPVWLYFHDGLSGQHWVVDRPPAE